MEESAHTQTEEETTSGLHAVSVGAPATSGYSLPLKEGMVTHQLAFRDEHS
jgi:hypothetical protein